ncbi:MAG TPA: hypothetical protein V6C81_30655 [Planktothrix sp.]
MKQENEPHRKELTNAASDVQRLQSEVVAIENAGPIDGVVAGVDLQLGQSIACTVLGAEPGGYTVWISMHNQKGFVPTERPLKDGEEIFAQYICMHNDKMLLSLR